MKQRPHPKKGQRGRHREKGDRLPPLKTLVDTVKTWTEAAVRWYGGEVRTVMILSGTCLWYSAGEKPLPILWVLVRNTDRATAEALFSTDLSLDPSQIIEWFILRWNIEVTFQETRAHLGVQTQRQWSDRAIARSTPSLMALFSIVTLAAIRLFKAGAMPVMSTPWYDRKGDAAFSDVLACVRREIWRLRYFNDSGLRHDHSIIPPPDVDTLLDQLARVA